MSKNNIQKLDLLVFAPHPDDAEMFCGGLIISSVRQGYKVGIIDLSQGELSSRGNLNSRRKETELATKILGIQYRENLSFPDGKIGEISKKISRESQLSKIVGLIRKLSPSMVLIPYWEDRHPDHSRTSELLSESVFFTGVKKFKSTPNLPAIKPPLNIYYQYRVAFKPSFITDISSVYEAKYNAIKCYSSQFGLDKNSSLNFPTLISSPLSLTSLQSKDAYYGSMIGVQYGEPYLLKNAISIDDPISTLNSNKYSYIFP